MSGIVLNNGVQLSGGVAVGTCDCLPATCCSGNSGNPTAYTVAISGVTICTQTGTNCLGTHNTVTSSGTFSGTYTLPLVSTVGSGCCAVCTYSLTTDSTPIAGTVGTDFIAPAAFVALQLTLTLTCMTADRERSFQAALSVRDVTSTGIGPGVFVNTSVEFTECAEEIDFTAQSGAAATGCTSCIAGALGSAIATAA